MMFSLQNSDDDNLVSTFCHIFFCVGVGILILYPLLGQYEPILSDMMQVHVQESI